MTTFLLIRHANCDPVGRSIAGRRPGIHLNAEGKKQALALAARLSQLALAGVYSSPLERARETAEPIAAKHALEVHTAPGLNEIDFGEWTGRTLTELDAVPDWRAFNSFRSGTRAPGGETMLEIVARAVAELDRLRRAHPSPEALIALVSHGDVLRGIVAHCLGVPLDLFQRIELSPASVSILTLDSHGPRLRLLNSTDGWPDDMALRSRR
jgi:probable phosphomutase (TIGR03848 family)